MQEIIVYHSPGDKLMWDFVLSGDMVPVMGGMAATLITFVILEKFTRKIFPLKSITKTTKPYCVKLIKLVNGADFMLTMGIIVGIIVCKWLWI